MKIVIDTKEDLHNMRHILRLLQAISINAGSGKYDFNDEYNDSGQSSPVPETPSGIFNMFDSSPSSSVLEEKKDEDRNDLSDSLQVY